MAFDIFVACCRNGESSPFKRALAQEILGRDAIKPEDALYDVAYPDGSGSSVYCDEEDDIDDVMVNHSGGDMFFDRLWELADRTGSVIFWPGDGPPVAVTREETIPHLPDDLSAAKPVIVRNGKELQAAIEQIA